MFQNILNVVWTFIYRFWLLAETVIHAHPDPFLHVETRCARLRLPRTVRPRKMTLVRDYLNLHNQVQSLLRGHTQVLDLDETLVHSSQKKLARFDWKVRWSLCP
jgi:hypothetical protein